MTTTKKTAKQKTAYEEFKIDGQGLVAKIKELIKEGNVRRIIIKDKQGQSLLEIPVTIAVVGAALAPILAAVGAIAALIGKCSIVVERRV